MPDITMCKGVKDGITCPNRGECYRYLAKPDPLYQSYFSEAPFRLKPDGIKPDCDHYWHDFYNGRDR